MLMTPVLYNGWRHFYFVYAVIAIFALFGFQALLTLAKKKSFAVYIPFGLYMASLVLWIGRNHPSEFVYFNYPARSYASQNMDKDYWNVGAASAVITCLKTSGGSSFSVIFYPQ